MKYFKECTNKEQAKAEWLRLSLVHHPDRTGGDEALFKEINGQYQEWIKQFEEAGSHDFDADLDELNLLLNIALGDVFSGIATRVAGSVFKGIKKNKALTVIISKALEKPETMQNIKSVVQYFLR